MKSSIGVGLIGMGTVGSGVARIITESSLLLSNQVGLPLILNKVAVNDVHKQRSFMVPQNILGENPEELINDDSKLEEMSVLAFKDPSTGGNPIKLTDIDFLQLLLEHYSRDG